MNFKVLVSPLELMLTTIGLENLRQVNECHQKQLFVFLRHSCYTKFETKSKKLEDKIQTQKSLYN